ncbi:MAG: prolipoprotein diacylglyceryl transferase [Fusobacteriaceae bacterium]
MNPVFLEIGPIKIYYYGLMYAISFFLGIEIAKYFGKKRGISPDLIENYAFIAMLSGLLGGRLYYVLFNLNYYLSTPAKIFAVWEGGMAIHGGIIGGIIGTIIYGKIKKINPFLLGDAAAPALILGQALGRIGNLMNGEVHGVPTFTPFSIIFSFKPQFVNWFQNYLSLGSLEQMNYETLVPWGITFPETSPAGAEFPGLPLHPAMLYEGILNFIGFIVLSLILHKRKDLPSGTVWWIYIIIYSCNRIFISFFRAEDLMIGMFRAPHLISVLMIFIAGIILFSLKKNNSQKKEL